MPPFGRSTRTSTSRRLRSLALLASALIGAQAPADEPPGLAAARRGVEQATTSADRAHAVDALLTIRAQRIADRPDDPQRPTWLADQAADYLQLVLPIDSSWMACRFGVPDDAQRARVQRAIAAMGAAAAEAELEIDRAVRELGATGSATRRRLIESERQRRIPFLRGVAACLEADLGQPTPAARAELYRLAAQRLAPLGQVLPRAAATQANLHAGLALAGRRQWDDATLLLSEVAERAEASSREGLAARLALVEIAAARDGVAAGLDRLVATGRACTSTFCRLLVADLRFRMLRDAGRTTEAYRAYTDLLPLHGMGPHVFARLTRVADVETPDDQLPGLVAAARAARLAGADATRAQGLARLRALIDGDRLDEAARGEALLALAVAHLDAGQTPQATRALIELARQHTTHHRAEQAIELAVTLAAEWYRVAAPDALARSQLSEALDVLMSKYPNRAGPWRYTAGCLALDEHRYGQAARWLEQIPRTAPRGDDAQRRRVEAYLGIARQDERWEQLVDVIETLPSGLAQEPVARAARAEAMLALDRPEDALKALGPARGEAAALLRIEALEALGRGHEVADVVAELSPHAGSAMLAAMLTERVAGAEAAQREGRADAALRLSLVPLAEALIERLNDQENPEARLTAAVALRLAGRHERALTQYDHVQRALGEPVDIVFGRAECLYGLSRDAEAMELYKRLSIAADRAGDEVWWQTQMRMLQILDRTGHNTHRIRPHVQRLRERDPELGGGRYRRELERLAMKNRPNRG